MLNGIHNAILKFNNITQMAAYIVDTLIAPLSILFHDPADHFGRNGSNFLGYRLLKTFQSLQTMSVYLSFEVTPEKKSHSVKLANTAATRCHHTRRQHAQEFFSENSE
jgi:hypothetical protein